MIRNTIYTWIAVISLLLFNACTDDFGEKKSDVVEGIPTSVKLSFKADDVPEITTRSAINDTEESKISDLWILVFDEKSGNLENKQAIDVSKTSCQMTIQSGTKRIYGIANSVGSTFRLAGSIESIETFGDFEKLKARMNNPDIFRTGSLLMCGAITTKSSDDITSDIITITPATTDAGTINLKRVDARIKFEISCGSEGTFIPKTWKVVNAPSVTFVKGGEVDAMTSDNDYFTSEERNFENLAQGKGDASSFVFYMAENRKEAKNGITRDEYVKREKQDEKVSTTNDPDDRPYTYADPKAAYVVMTGTYTETNPQGVVILKAEVKYTVHLGYVGNDATDFKNKRNNTYTYTANILGVDNIILEVKNNGEENQPGAEGDVIIAQKQYVMDAHYGVKLITFHKDSVSKYPSFFVNTPLGNGQYWYRENEGWTNSFNSTDDFQWIKFVKCDSASAFVQYPGDDSEKLLNVKTVIENILKDNTAVKDFTYTVFIDEYYYKDRNWNIFVNKPNRELQVLCDTKYSPDKESSLTTSSFVISQRSIKTFYNTNNAEVNKAWGIETEREGGRVYNATTSSSTNDDGYETFYNNVHGKNYNAYVKFEDNTLNDVGRHSVYACLQRNRDENGDGIIDQAEIKWYLPSLKQMTGLWIGKEALPSETQLVQDGIQSQIIDGNKAKIFHFITSDGMVFWAEEGSSTSQNHKDQNLDIMHHGISSLLKDMSIKDLLAREIQKGAYFDYRCVRNLKNDKTLNSSGMQEYAVYNARTFNLRNMAPNTLKNSISNDQQSKENELHSNNRPYISFQVAERSFTKTRSEVERETNPCKNYTENDNPTGAGAWRMPTQRELSLIHTYANGLTFEGYTYSNTKPSLPYKEGGLLYAIRNNPKDVVLDNDNYPGGKMVIRCVRDVPFIR